MRRLGKLPHVPDSRVLSIHTVVPELALPPKESNWYAAVGDWPMLGNDRIGNCVPVAALHEIQRRRAYAGLPTLSITDEHAIALYGQWAGYDPSDPATDGGTIITAALSAWAADGVLLPDNTVDQVSAYASLALSNETLLQQGINLCGAVIAGFMCPFSWVEDDELYILNGNDIHDHKSVGGHCMLMVGYEQTARGVEYDVITWGARCRLIAPLEVMDEAFVILDRDDLDARGFNPAGVDWDTLTKAMTALRTV